MSYQTGCKNWVPVSLFSKKKLYIYMCIIGLNFQNETAMCQPQTDNKQQSYFSFALCICSLAHRKKEACRQ